MARPGQARLAPWVRHAALRSSMTWLGLFFFFISGLFGAMVSLHKSVHKPFGGSVNKGR